MGTAIRTQADRPIELSWWWVLLGAIAVVARVLSTGILEVGDGIQHHMIARHAWEHPTLFLHHWGKPLYTLFSSPFAQLGYWGGAVFNALCFIGTCWAADGLLRRMGLAARLLFPPVVLFAPVYGLQVFEGMTEIFFALLAMVALRFAMDQRPQLFAITVSFLPFSRPEYIAVWPFAILWLSWQRQWRALPWLFTGHVVFALLGALFLGDFFWAFHQDPYVGAEGIYGSGALDHFVAQLPSTLGGPLLVALILAIPASIWCYAKLPAERHGIQTMLLLGLMPALAVLVIHSLLWWTGSKGSLGLTRVLATVVPLVVLFTILNLAMVIDAWTTKPWQRWCIAVPLVLLAPYFTVAALVEAQHLPVKANAQQVFLEEAGVRMAQLAKDAPHVYYLHPYLGYASGLDPFGEQVRNHLPNAAEMPTVEEGTLIVWDAHFGPNEGAVPLETFLEDGRLRLLDMMVPAENLNVLGGRPLEVYFFERRSTETMAQEHRVILDAATAQWPITAHRIDTLPCGDQRVLCFNPSEFPLEVTGVFTTADDLLYSDLRIRGKALFEVVGDSSVQMILAESDPTGLINYSVRLLENGPFDLTYRVPKRAPEVANKVYLWNRSGVSVRLEELEIAVERYSGKH